MGYDVEASIMKNYIDLKPDRTSYTIVLVTPVETSGMDTIDILSFKPIIHELVEMYKTTPDPTATYKTWTDATYTSTVNAIETNDFTNNPGKVGSIEK